MCVLHRVMSDHSREVVEMDNVLENRLQEAAHEKEVEVCFVIMTYFYSEVINTVCSCVCVCVCVWVCGQIQCVWYVLHFVL